MDPDIIELIMGMRKPGQTFGPDDAAEQDAKLQNLASLLIDSGIQSRPEMLELISIADRMAASDDPVLNRAAAITNADALVHVAMLNEANSAIADALGVPEGSVGLPTHTKDGASRVYQGISHKAARMRDARDERNAQLRRAAERRRDLRNRLPGMRAESEAANNKKEMFSSGVNLVSGPFAGLITDLLMNR